MKRIAGFALLGLLFAAYVGAMIWKSGLTTTLVILGGTAAFVGLVFLALHWIIDR